MNEQNKVLIIGAGVIGLTTAYCLAKANYKVKIVSKDFSPNITSNVAGALWEWPPAVCGYHSDQISLERSKEWCMTSYSKFYDLAKNKATGVFIRDVIFFFREKVEKNDFHRNKMRELQNKVLGFRHDPLMIKEEGINTKIGFVDAYKHEAPMIDTDQYMTWLTEQVRILGVEIIKNKISGSLNEMHQELKESYDCEYIINCTGLGASELANEEMYPLRGALVRLKNKIGMSSLKLNKAYCVSFDEKTREQNIVFIVPRGDNTIILGALAEENKWDVSINLENYKPIKDMYDRCKEFLPVLSGVELDNVEPVRAGLRPFRKGNVRLELDRERKIIHNYGHGGAGVTFSWGCAEEVISMLKIS